MNRSPQTITVTVVARLPVQQYGLRALITDDPDLVPGQAVPDIDQVTVSPRPRPHVIVYYLDEVATASEDLVATLIEQGMEVVVLVGPRTSVQSGVMIRLGVRGVLGCAVDRREFGSAIRHVAWGRSYVSPAVASDLLLRPQESDGEDLTGREQEILVRVATGETDREIARALGIAVRTVRSHLDNVRRKTGQRRRPDLTRYAITHGLWPGTDGELARATG